MSITQLSENLWVRETPGTFFGLEVGSRMTIVRDASSRLFVLSPVALDAELRRDVEALGVVHALIAPSLFHHLHLQQWIESYPDALLAACPGLEWKRPELPINYILGDQEHPLWTGTMQQVYFSARRENELVFFHPESKTLICTDSMLNLANHHSPMTRNFARAIGNRVPGFTHLERFMVRDRALARRQLDRILAWDFDSIVLAHGQLIPKDGRAIFQKAYSWV